MTQNMLSTQYLFHCQGPRLPELHPLFPAGLWLPDINSVSLHAWDAWNRWGLTGKQTGFRETRVRFSFLSDRRNLLPDTTLLCTSCVYSPFCQSSLDRSGCCSHWSRYFLPRSCSARTDEIEDIQLKMWLLNFELCLVARDHRGSSTNAAQWVWTPLVWAQTWAGNAAYCVPSSPKSLQAFCQALGRIYYTPRVRVCLLQCIRLKCSLHSFLKLGHLGHVWFSK